MARRKKGSKVKKRAKLRRGNSVKRGKPRMVARSAAKRAKPKRAPAKRAARREVAPAVEIPVQGIEQQEPGAAGGLSLAFSFLSQH